MAVLISLCLASSAVAGNLPKKSAQWTELETAGFTFVSGLGEPRTRRVAHELEAFRAVLVVLTGENHVPSIPTKVYLFRGASAFRNYLPLHNGKPKPVGGYFHSPGYAHFMAADASQRGNLERILYHEYVHQVLREHIPFLPLWFNEGLAEFYSTFEATGNTASIGIPHRDHIQLLRERSLMSPQDLLAVNTSSEEYNHRNKAGVFYAQSWLTVHYLFMERENGRQNVIEFLQRYSQRAPTEEDFRSVFSIGYADLRRELQRYVKRSTFPYQRLDTSAAKPEAGSFRRLERSEVLAALGELAVHMRPEVARRHFEASLELASDQPRAIAGLAELTASDDQEKAHGLFRQAAESENDDASIHYRYALSMIRSGDSPEQIVSQLRRSVEIDPSYGPAWAQLALTHVSMSSTPEDAIEIALRALNLLPARVDLAFCLMQTYLSKNDFIGAMNVVDQYLSIADDGRHVRRAHQLLAKAELRQAEKFVESGKLDDARSLLDHIDHELGDSLDFLLSRRLDKLKKEVEQ